MDEDLVLLKATCRSCGATAEVGYIQGRARVTVTEHHCQRCGQKGPAASNVSAPLAPLSHPKKRIGPKASPRRRGPSARARA